MAYGCAGVQSRLDSCLQRTNERTNSSRCPSELQPTEIGLSVWGTAANFDRFYFLASLLQRRRLPEANQTLHDLWPSPGLVQYIYIFGGFCPLTEFWIWGGYLFTKAYCFCHYGIQPRAYSKICPSTTPKFGTTPSSRIWFLWGPLACTRPKNFVNKYPPISRKIMNISTKLQKVEISATHASICVPTSYKYV